MRSRFWGSHFFCQKSNMSAIRNHISPSEAKTFDTRKIRNEFLVQDLMIPNEVSLVYTHYDRMIIGGVVPGEKTLNLSPLPYQKAAYFNQRRETGIINVGQKGTVTVDGTPFTLSFKEALYVGLGAKHITFESDDPNQRARFYLNAALANTKYPHKVITYEMANKVPLGDQKHGNTRSLNQYIVPDLVQTCQLMMGITEVSEGNVWNIMPCHIHRLRMEVYFYFDFPADESICHIMGEPQETRNIWIRPEEAVISPDWSIHTAAGTTNYAFIWGMAGSDSEMDGVKTHELQ